MKKSFTLIELVVTISVIAAIAAFGVGQYSNVTREATLARVKSDLKTVKDAATQYLYKTEHIPVNNSGLGLKTSDFKLADDEYVMVNLELLANKQLLEDGTEIPASVSKVPVSALYTRAGIKNTKKQEPSFIYVMDNNFNIYLAEGKKDEETGYFIHTKIYETPNSDLYDNKVKMAYEGNKPILEGIDITQDSNTDNSTIVKDNIQTSPDLGFDIPSGGGNSGIENNTDTNKLYYKNLSVAGFTVFLDMYDIDLNKIKSIQMEVTAGASNKTITLYAVRSTRWFGRVDAEDFNNYSGNYNCRVYAVTKENKKVDIEDFDVLVDRIKPTTTISKNKSDFYSNNPIQITITAKDPELSSGIKKIEYKLNDDDWREYTAPFTLSEVDYYEIQAKATDNFRNESALATTIINDYTKPEVYLSKTSTGVSINLGVDVADEDVLWQNGFEATDPSVELNHCDTPAYGTNGGQSIVNNEGIEDSRAYMLLKNDNGNGNIYILPDTSSNISRISFGSIKNAIRNNIHLAFVYRYKSYGKSTIAAHLDGGFARKIEYYTNTIVLEDVPVGSTVIKLNNVSNVKVGKHVTSDTDDNSVGFLPRIEKIDTVNNTITLTAPLNRTLKAGEKLAYRGWRHGGSFDTNNVDDTNGEWRIFTTVMQTNQYDDYDLYTHGSGLFLVHNTASNKLYLDNVKMGFASRMILYKNGKRFNTTSQEYTTSYTDNNVPDKDKPVISNINISSYENNFNIEIEASDVGTQYTYHMESISRSGKVTESKKRSITITSGIKQFYYIIDNNPSAATVPTTQKTSDYVINKTLDTNKCWYIHIVAEDEAGNKSSVYHKQIT